MEEVKERNSVMGKKKSPRVAAKICEHMTYSGREAFKRLRTNAMIALAENAEKKCQVIGITSAQPSEGKSTVSINLAYSLAELGKSVLLIDGDMRRPTIHTVIDIPVAPGLSEVLGGEEKLSNTITKYRSSTNETTFSVIPSGELPGNPSELLNSERFKMLMEAAANAFDFIVVDLPPVGAVIDAVNVAKLADGMIVVLRENRCPRYVLAECVDQLRYAKANILGFVLNGCMEGSGKHYQYHQLQQYRYGK